MFLEIWGRGCLFLIFILSKFKNHSIFFTYQNFSFKNLLLLLFERFWFKFKFFIYSFAFVFVSCKLAKNFKFWKPKTRKLRVPSWSLGCPKFPSLGKTSKNSKFLKFHIQFFTLKLPKFNKKSLEWSQKSLPTDKWRVMLVF